MGARHHLRGVDIWRTSLVPVPGGDRTLSTDELERADRFVFPVDRERFVAARVWLRRILGEVTGTEPAELEFGYGELGKPFLVGSPGLGFSLAHSQDEAVLAVVPGRRVGADIEMRSSLIEPQGAGLVLSPRELAAADNSEDRRLGLLRCWVRKEAYAKAAGGGIDRHLTGLTLTDEKGVVSSLDGWEIFDLPPEPEVLGAVAVESAS